MKYFILLSVLLILVFFLVFFIHKVVVKRMIRNQLRNKYNYLIRQYDLTVKETDLMNHMAPFLANPQKKYLLLQNRGTFSYALKRLSMAQEVQEDIVASVQKKLGFPPVEHKSRLITTSDIFKGAPVAVQNDEKRFFLCLSQGLFTEKLVLRTGKRGAKVNRGDRVTLFTYNYRKLYVFISKVLSVDKESFTVSEAEAALNSIYKNINLPVYINFESMDDDPVKTELVTINATGAVIKNPHKKVKRGDDIRIMFHPKLAPNIHLNGEVERVSIDRKYIYTVFSHLKKEKL